MVPHRDPDPAPVRTSVSPLGYQTQFLRRGRYDQYGTERERKKDVRARPIEPRNGLPVRWYRYRGTGESRPELDAQWVRDMRRKVAK